MPAQSDAQSDAQSSAQRAQELHTQCVSPVKGTHVVQGVRGFVQYAVEPKPVVGQWQNIRVVIPFKSKRRTHLNYWLSWNGVRWARSGELERLCRWYPDVAEEITALMESPSGTA